jgi:carboxyl-terminal processing protease
VEDEFDIELERQEITIFTIKGFERNEDGDWKYMIDPQQKIGYVRMTNFTEGTIDELKDVVSRLREDAGMRGLIFDLRGNPGGPLKSAVDVSDLFLPGDKQIVSTRDRHNKPWATSTGDGEHFTDFPLILITNRTSASASEIVAGALQVHQRALIVGERTFGKGSVQQVLRLNNNNSAFLKLTTAHYYLPDGRCLHRDEDSVAWGVDPDVEVKLVPKEIVKANLLRLKTDILKGVNQQKLSQKDIDALTEYRNATQPAKGDKAESQPSEAHGDDESDEESEDDIETVREDPNDYPEVDAQLEAALMVMRIRLESNEAWPLRAPRMAANAAATTGR